MSTSASPNNLGPPLPSLSFHCRSHPDLRVPTELLHQPGCPLAFKDLPLSHTFWLFRVLVSVKLFSKVIEVPLFFFCASFTLLSLKSIPQAQLPPDSVQSPRALCARGEVICLFIAGLIKTVMCRELFGPQSMHFDLESQIESHLALVGPRLAAQAGDRCCCLSTLAALDLNKFSRKSCHPACPDYPQLDLPARPRPSWSGQERLNTESTPGALQLKRQELDFCGSRFQATKALPSPKP